jgi:diphosphomevalonate decarboxylase
MIVATARAHANIALAKYWGKADIAANMPAVPSVSMTLDAMSTETRVCFDPSLSHDVMELNGAPAPDKALKRATQLLDRVRQEAASSHYARITTSNNFPTASGLASSASGFAALALAARAAAGLTRDMELESSLARQSSASAARSLFGGYAALDRGSLAARRIAGAEHLPLELVVAVISEGPKGVGSTEGMEHTRATSPYYQAWVEYAPVLAAKVERAILAADLATLGPLVEQSALLMHASMFGADPAIVYFQPATLAVLDRVRRLRVEGVLAFCTMDAGPHVKVICSPGNTLSVRNALEQIPGVLRTLSCKLGPDASVTTEEHASPARVQ